MGEQDIIANLQGPMGGTFALGILVGSLLMWYANLKVVNPYVLRAHTAEMAAMQARIGTLKAEVHELRQFRDQYMELLERHSKPTLGGRS